MIFDQQNLFSDGQAITATAASTNYIDLGATGTVPGADSAVVRDIGKGTPIPLRIQITEAFNNLTSLTVALQVDDNTSFSSPTTVESEVVALADLTLGAVVNAIKYIPPGVDERYVRLNYTVTGTAPTAGKVTAGVVAAHQEN
jgi:hypothetical protein